MIRKLVPTLLLLAMAPAAMAAPLQMQHISVAFQETDAQGKVRETWKKDIWRAGTEYGRINEPSTSAGAPIVIVEPQRCWEVDTAKRQAKYFDAQKQSQVHFRILKAHGRTADM